MSTPAIAARPAISPIEGARSLTDWMLAPAPPGAASSPSQLDRALPQWTPARAPGTVAQALQASGQWSIDQPMDFDASDWWYLCRFETRTADAHLRFQGLATLAEVWLNDQLILTAGNMFREYRVDVGGLLQPGNELVICFRSLSAALAKRRPRPQWKTRLVSHQQLRWFRTTLLGRIPGWSPPVAPVGPWRPVILEESTPGAVIDPRTRASLDGAHGTIDFSCEIRCDDAAKVSGTFSAGDVSRPLVVERVDRQGGLCRLHGHIRLDAPRLWWPHTHGTPELYPTHARIAVDGRVIEHDGVPVGFRRLAAGGLGEGFGLEVNGAPVFCRGACWACSDIVSLAASPADLLRDLTRLRDAGANMVRVGGTMIYESDAFYRACDALGLLVWQDFMFANMDYPVDDEAFLESAAAEAAHQLQRLSPHPCVAVYCGNSEVEQQAAMLGMPRELWRNRLFADVLPALCAKWHADVPYVPSTPCGGALPFHVGDGLAHYYGVGAYRRPLADVRRAGVRFTPECLGFANVPEPALVDRLMQGDAPMTHDPRWKRRTPRDTGAGWDFEDVRDHYLAQLFALDSAALRAADPQRYLAISRVTSGELMSQVFAEWRSPHSRCRGALVWFFKDLWPGAGWGLIDSDGHPKACYYYARRAWQPQAVLITDEGLDGLQMHVINDGPRLLAGTVSITLLREGRVPIAHGETRCRVEPQGRATFGSDDLLGGFYDVSYAYRFGRLTHTVAAARLVDDSGTVLSETFWFPDLGEIARAGRHAVTAAARPVGDDAYDVTIESDSFLYAVRVDADGFQPDDNYFCLMPDREKVIRLQRTTASARGFGGYVEALNLIDPVRIDAGSG
jgi:beta-mannosidase